MRPQRARRFAQRFGDLLRLVAASGLAWRSAQGGWLSAALITETRMACPALFT
jgi:hypothetical protein